jgi:hypothetical protein
MNRAARKRAPLRLFRRQRWSCTHPTASARAKHTLVTRLESMTKAALHDNRSQEYNGNAGIVFLRSEFLVHDSHRTARPGFHSYRVRC